MFAPPERAGLTIICDRCGAERRVPGQAAAASVNRLEEKSETVLAYRSQKTASPAPKWRPSRWTVIVLIGCALGYLLMLLVALVTPKDTTYEQHEVQHTVVDLFWIGVLIAIVVLGILYGLRSVLKYQPRTVARATSTDSPFDEISDVPGTYEVKGVNKETRRDAVQNYDADGSKNAKIKAELDGMIVSSVRRISDR